MTRYRDDMAGLVKARKPLKPKSLKGWDVDAAIRIIMKDDIEDISELISSIESDHKGIPILLKQYLKLGGRITRYNVSSGFRKRARWPDYSRPHKDEQRQILDRYMGKVGAELFLAYHEALKRDRYATSA